MAPMSRAKHRDFVPEELPVRERHQLLLAGVAPRPIALVGSVSERGDANLAPFSFFNAFGANPVYVAFSPALRGTNGGAKDTLRNVLATREFTISVVSHSMVHQMNLASAEYPFGTDEFTKAGFRKLQSQTIGPPGVGESPFIMECRYFRHIELGGKGGSGNLIIGEVVLFRVREDVYDDDGRIDPLKMDQAARLGYDWYTSAMPELFELAKPQGHPIGFAALPQAILRSKVLTGSDLSKLAEPTVRPDTAPFALDFAATYGSLSEPALHEQVKVFLDGSQLAQAWALVELIEARFSSSSGANA